MAGPFLFDDLHLPISDPGSPRFDPAFWLANARPVLMATYWINYAIWKNQPFSYHVVSLLFHLLAAGIACRLLRELLQLAGIAANTHLLALFGTGIFLLHPLQTESVAYISGRSEVVAGMFYLAAWLVFVRSFAESTTLLRALTILIFAGLAVAAKQSAISLPAVLALTDLYWKPASFMEQAGRRVKLYVPILLAGPVAIAGILKSMVGESSVGFGTYGVTPVRYALTQCRVIFIYMRLFLVPWGQNGDWRLPFFQSFSDRRTWIYAAALLGLVSTIIWTYRRARLFSFGLAIFLITLLPTSSFVPVADALTERRLYLPILGLTLALIWAVQFLIVRWRGRSNTRDLQIVTIGLVFLVGVLCFERTHVWGSDLLFWGDSVRKNPENARALLGLGNAHLTRGLCGDAVHDYQAAERQDGQTDELAMNLAAAYSCNKQGELALKLLRQQVAKHPYPATFAQLGYLEATLGHTDAALTALREALDRDPGNANAYAYRGVIRIAQGDRQGGETDLRRALEIEPGNPAATTAMTMLQGRH